ncbi:hypothetical protein WJX73_003548 [Symbiochloris irregularis]|uniref:Uncharacterized protein n=1 Tax=Symbiochloris irregularis TaxID=706552 RepID=A0AAW1PV91_9CHLO
MENLPEEQQPPKRFYPPNIHGSGRFRRKVVIRCTWEQFSSHNFAVRIWDAEHSFQICIPSGQPSRMPLIQESCSEYTYGLGLPSHGTHRRESLRAMPIAYIDVPQQLEFPADGADRHAVLTAPYLVVDGVDTPLGYNTILRTGQRARREEEFPFGQVLDESMSPIYEVNAAGLPNKSNVTFSHYADFTSLLQVEDKLFSFVHFESPVPSAMYLMELAQNLYTCQLTAISQQPVDWSAWGGLWTPCAGSVTPWGTHLGSEEYEPNALGLVAANTTDELENFSDVKGITDFLRYYGVYEANVSMSEIQDLFNPYRYGHATELTAFYNGSYQAVKHYSMGRQSYELPYVMPDNVTVYSTDDGENTMLTMFKASTPSDLSCGTLYGAAFTQLSSEDGGNFTIEWLDMGEACDEEMRAYAENSTFLDIFSWVPYDNTSSPSCPAGFTAINAGAPNGAECLRLQPGMEVVASRLETRRYLAYIGGTTEFTKWEGLTFAPSHGEFGKIYTSMSRIENSMEDFGKQGKNSSHYDEGGRNSIRLPWNRCGCVYQLDIDESYMATTMYPLICGNNRTNTDANNKCDINSISAPDNIAMLQGHNELIIGEDTSDHQNDAVWLYNFDTKALRRVETTPYGAEATSAYWYENINGCAYWVSVVQHPYGESDQTKISELASTGTPLPLH